MESIKQVTQIQRENFDSAIKSHSTQKTESAQKYAFESNLESDVNFDSKNVSDSTRDSAPIQNILSTQNITSLETFDSKENFLLEKNHSKLDLTSSINDVNYDQSDKIYDVQGMLRTETASTCPTLMDKSVPLCGVLENSLENDFDEEREVKRDEKSEIFDSSFAEVTVIEATQAAQQVILILIVKALITDHQTGYAILEKMF